MAKQKEQLTNSIKSNNLVDKIRTKKDDLPEKEFVIRNSVLTDLLKDKHIRTVYHIFAAIFVGLFVKTLAHDYLIKEEVKIGLISIKAGFRNVHWSILAWLVFYVFTCMAYMLFNIWGRIRITFGPKSGVSNLWDKVWLLGVIGYYVFSFRLASILASKLDLPPPACAIVVIEQTRLLMKVHAYIRSNARKVLEYKPKSDQVLVLPKFSHFVYFTFAPTLVYRDQYPRTDKTNWNHVWKCSIEAVAILFYYSFVLERLLIPFFQDFGIRKFTKTEIILSVIENAVTGVLLLLTTFYLILHCIQNIFAELLRFGDRMFYKAWWLSVSYSEYYRTWNVIVHDWLYTYIYKDMVQNVTPNNRILGKLAVFLVSAIVHEWILTYMFGFCLPALFVEFFILGSVLNFVTVPNISILNILFWYSLALGSGSLSSIYCLEYFARLNVPIQNETIIDFFIPRFLTCDCFV